VVKASRVNSPVLSQLGRDVSSEGAFEGMNALAAASDAVQAASAINTQFTLAAGQAVKLSVRREGWYRVDGAQLRAAGLAASANPASLRLYAGGVEQAMLVAGQAQGRVDAVEFYGLGIDTTWSDTQVYWLAWGGQNGRRIQTQTGTGGGTAPASFPYTLQWKPRSLYFVSLVNGDADNFFGPVLGPAADEKVTQSLPLAGLAAGASGFATLQVRMQGGIAGSHVVEVKLNDSSLGTMTFQDLENKTASFDVANSILTAGANTLTLTALGGTQDYSAVDTVLLTYPRGYTAEGDSLRLTAPTGAALTIGGFTQSNVRVMDVTDPANVSALAGTVTPQTGGGYSVAVSAGGLGTRTLLAFADTKAAPPARVAANQPSNWHSAQTDADMVILAHGDLIASLGPLKTLRQSQGRRVAVVNVEDVYDEFNYGSMSPYAVRAFLSTANSTWRRKPRWVLLMGSATADPRNYLGLNEAQYVPVYLAGTSMLETASDDWYTDYNGDGIADVAIGRMPATSAAMAELLVGKVVAYEGAGAAGWKQKALLVAGTNDAENNFESQTSTLEALLRRVSVAKILQGQDPNATADLLAALNAGQGLVNYVGHGSFEIWQGSMLTSEIANALTNGAATPFVISMTCLNGRFQNTYLIQTLAEALLEAPGGGAVGVWASSGLTESASQALMNKAMIQALYGGSSSITVGEAAMAAKRATLDMDVRKTWILFGDPAMRLR
jgi:hypothetical protein